MACGTAAALIPTPYATLSPGRARAVEQLVTVRGADVHPPAGSILFLTVGVDDDVTLFEAAAGWLDRDVDVLPRSAVIPEGISEEENRRRNAAAMVGSKQTAAVVAAQRLGYDLDPSGSGAVVLAIVDGSPAAAHLQVGDTVVAVDGRPIRLSSDLVDAIGARAPGETVVLRVEAADGTAREEAVALAAREDDPAAGFLGVSTDTRDFDPGLPFEVEIDSGDVGGPSAGLAFTLALIELLTPGELTGGRTVAVTGTIDGEGRVGEIGGLEQKAAVAAAAGAEVFLVPAAEADEARASSRGLEVVPVATLDDALAALERLGGDPVALTS